MVAVVTAAARVAASAPDKKIKQATRDKSGKAASVKMGYVFNRSQHEAIQIRTFTAACLTVEIGKDASHWDGEFAG